jgi:hypothetical protein
MEATAIQLSINKELITLVSIYKTPGKIVERDLDLLQTGNKVILAGDFNAKHFTWHSRNKNGAGRVLLSHYNNNEYLITSPVRPTHVPDGYPGSADVLDLVILHNIVSQHTINNNNNNNLNTGSLTSSASTGDIDNAVIHLTDVLREAAQKAIPVKTRSFKSTQIVPSTRLLIQERNKLPTLWQRTHNIAASSYQLLKEANRHGHQKSDL